MRDLIVIKVNFCSEIFKSWLILHTLETSREIKKTLRKIHHKGKNCNSQFSFLPRSIASVIYEFLSCWIGFPPHLSNIFANIWFTRFSQKLEKFKCRSKSLTFLLRLSQFSIVKKVLFSWKNYWFPAMSEDKKYRFHEWKLLENLTLSYVPSEAINRQINSVVKSEKHRVGNSLPTEKWAKLNYKKFCSRKRKTHQNLGQTEKNESY